MRVEVVTWPPAADVLRVLGGRASRRDILAHATRTQLDQAVASGRVVRASRSAYALAGLPPALLVAASANGVLSHESAAEHHGFATVFPPRAVRVTVRRGSRPTQRPDVVIHEADLADHETAQDVTTPLRTVLDCAAAMPLREALAVADGALRQYPGLGPDLLAGAAAWRGRRRAQCLRVVEHASPLADNPFESALRGTVLDAGLTGFAPQVQIRTPSGRVRVDLADVGRRIVLEADSFQWHGDRQALAADCRRYAELSRAGWRVLRFAWEQVMFQEAWVAEVVADVVRGGWVERRA